MIRLIWPEIPMSMQSLPVDQRAQQGAWLFLASLLVFFLASIVGFLLYVSWRDEQFFRGEQLPLSFLGSTVLLVLISGFLHLASRTIKRENHRKTFAILVAALASSVAFLVVQGFGMAEIADAFANVGPSKGVTGMVFALAFLHALHVVGGVAALLLVVIRTWNRFYDHERNWGIRFAAQYWHFLDLVWLMMLAAFWWCSGGFAI